MPTFSERLNEALEYRNMTAAELARALEGCVLYKKDKKSIVRDKKSIAAGQKADSSGQKAENRAEENPLPGRFLVLS